MTERLKTHPWRARFIALLLFVLVLVAVPMASRALAGVPTLHTVLFNDAVLADTDLITDLRPTVSNDAVFYRVTVALVSTNTTLYVVTKSGATEIPGDFNGVSGDLTAGKKYTFSFGAARSSSAGEALTYNLRVEDATTIGELIVDEVQDGSL